MKEEAKKRMVPVPHQSGAGLQLMLLGLSISFPAHQAWLAPNRRPSVSLSSSSPLASDTPRTAADWLSLLSIQKHAESSRQPLSLLNFGNCFSSIPPFLHTEIVPYALSFLHPNFPSFTFTFASPFSPFFDSCPLHFC
jgi:hypothetical protein